MTENLWQERDPVCGRHVTEDRALLRTEYEGKTYLFCSESCRMLFSIRPGWFVEGQNILTGTRP
jgi:YHS domain-containing protein